MIPVTKPYLPDRKKLDRYIDGIYQRGWLTNNGPLVQELTQRLEDYLGVENLLLVGNGTLALQVAYRTLNISEACSNRSGLEAVTTPFSFVATTSSLKWEGVEPRFADIDQKSWCIDPQRIEEAITERTKAIIPVHVFGNICDVNGISEIARKHNLPVIYDAAHAFGVKYHGKSILTYGDASILSFHATKLFHSIEGGAIVFRHKRDLDKARKIINFGLTSPDTIGELGINAKMNEFQAAMGLCVLDEIDKNISDRKKIWETYKQELSEFFETQERYTAATNNYAYFPLLVRDESKVSEVIELLKRSNIIARRYFYPSLDSIYYTESKHMYHSREISSRIICLPVYSGMHDKDVEKIIALMKRCA